jgi:galactose mutarotase-like enzyme
VTPGIIGLVCVALLIASYERGHGHFHHITDAVVAPTPTVSESFNAPGGQDAIRLTRTATTIGTQPEFLSATLLPGRGLEVLQITASIPGHGEVPLLAAPTLADALNQWTGTGADAHGALGATTAGAFLLPWAGRLLGHPGVQPGTVQVAWQGHTLTVPANGEGTAQSIQGLVLDRAVEAVKTSVLPDGQALQATLHGGDFAGAWPSTVDVEYSIEMTGHTLDMTLKATNTGSKPVPMGIGWKPHLAIPSGDRASATLTIPSITLSATDPHTGAPTGKTRTASDTGMDFSRAAGTPLGGRDIDATYTDLLQAGLADGPIAMLRDPGYNYTLRLIPLSASISRLHVEAPSGKPWIVIQPETNGDDPTGSQWQAPDDSGLVTLAPGASMLWKLRLEISNTVPPGGTAGGNTRQTP